MVDGATGNYYNYSYKWSTNPSYYVSGADYLDYNQYYVDLTAIAKGITTLTLTVTNPTTGATVGTDSVQLTVNSAADINVSGSVYGTSTSYGLTEITNTTNSYYGTSIYDQLVNAVRNLSGGARSLNHVIFNYKTATAGDLSATANYAYYVNGGYTNSATQTYGGLLSDVVFIPKTSGTAHFSFTAYDNTGKTYSGLMSITTDGTATGSGDINYAASIGDTQYFNAADFENLYYDKTNGGTLSYVTFSTPSSGTGTLYADGVRLTGVNSPCYLSPTRNQAALDSVYFTPSGSTATRAGTVRIGFTAYGNRGSSSSYYNRTITGTVVINYLNGTAKDITYTPVGGSVTLKASDFTDKYREVVGSNAPSDLTIQFQDVPANGSLSYKNSSSSSSSTVSLRSSNIKSYRFTTRTSGANQLGDVTYTSSGTRSDTISYIAYSGSTARFSGKVVFNPNTASTTLTVGLPCTGSAGVAFNAASFTLANTAVMANCSQIRFMAPTNGTLTYAGAAVSYSGVTVPVSMLGQIHYKPNAGFNNNTDRVAFICYDAAGNQIGSGQVNIVVSGNTGGASGGVTNIGGFTDLPKDGSGDWYMSVLSSLVSRGIVQGTGNGKAEPRGKLNYGQALKMILLAANYPAQTEVAGNDWAINYKNLAVQNGLISSSVVLTDPITRDAVVELAAKALKIAPVTGNSPFKDSNNGYAIALNRTSPQIIVGNANGTFNGSGTLLRQEVWMIIYRMYEYSNSQSSTQMPDGI